MWEKFLAEHLSSWSYWLNHEEIDAVLSVFHLWCNVKRLNPWAKHTCYYPGELFWRNSLKKKKKKIQSVICIVLKLLWPRTMKTSVRHKTQKQKRHEINLWGVIMHKIDRRKGRIQLTDIWTRKALVQMELFCCTI